MHTFDQKHQNFEYPRNCQVPGVLLRQFSRLACAQPSPRLHPRLGHLHRHNAGSPFTSICFRMNSWRIRCWPTTLILGWTNSTLAFSSGRSLWAKKTYQNWSAEETRRMILSNFKNRPTVSHPEVKIREVCLAGLNLYASLTKV